MKRYQQLLQLIDLFQPKRLLEIGTWNGDNAIRMLNQAARYHTDVDYQGYDLFEDATAETDAREFNVKPHNNKTAVFAKIREHTGQRQVFLVQGDTNQTLSDGMTRDFVFIDGGHSLETISNDYEKLKRSKIVVLDDFYTPDSRGMPDIIKYGCNKLVEGIPHAVVLPSTDQVSGGGFVHLVLVVA